MHFKTNTQTEESHVKHYQTCSGRIPEKTSSQKAAEQNHDQRSDHRLWHQPYGFLLSFQRYENKPFIINAYNAISREQIENFLFQLTHDLIMSVVEEQARSTSLTQEQKSFIADFYKYSFVGIMLDWIRQGMKSDYTDIWKNMCITIHGNITNSIQNFTKHAK